MNGGAYVSRSAGYVLSTGTVGVVVNLSQATPNVQYTFRYTTSPGLLCERSTEVFIFLGTEPESGTGPTIPPQCWHTLRDGYLGGNPVMNLWDQLTGGPSEEGT